MGLFTTLKRNARLIMRRHWGGGALILLMEIGASGLISALQQVALSVFVINPAVGSISMEDLNPGAYMGVISDMLITSKAEWIIVGVSSLLSMLLIFPLSLGAIRWYFKVAQGENPSITEAFFFFETPRAYAKALWYDISIGVRTTFWALLFYALPGAVMWLSIYALSLEGGQGRLQATVATAGVCFSALLFLGSTLLYLAFIYRYALVPYLICEDGGITVKNAIKTSILYTKGFRFSLLWFSFSFFGWVLLCIFFLPIFFVIPYNMAASALYARYILEKNRRESQPYAGTEQ